MRWLVELNWDHQLNRQERGDIETAEFLVDLDLAAFAGDQQWHTAIRQKARA